MTRPSQQWAEPGVFEVAPGVHRIPLPLPDDGLRAVNVYAVADGERVALIDSGWALEESRKQLAEALDAIGYGLEQISDFFVTHVHRDHYTQAVAIRRALGTRVSLGEGERASLEALTPEHLVRPVSQMAQLERCGAADVAAALRLLPADETADARLWAPPDVWMTGGTEIRLAGRTLRAIHTPGHTQGHLVFLDADAKVLFAGDHVLPHITPSIGFEARAGASPLGDYLASLRLMRAMPDVRLLPAHGPVAESVHQRVDELLEHHADRLDTTLAAVRSGADTARAAAGVLRWTRRGRTLGELDPFNQMLAVLETGSHLEVLVERGRLRAEDVDGVRHYALA